MDDSVKKDKDVVSRAATPPSRELLATSSPKKLTPAQIALRDSPTHMKVIEQKGMTQPYTLNRRWPLFRPRKRNG